MKMPSDARIERALDCIGLAEEVIRDLSAYKDAEFRLFCYDREGDLTNNDAEEDVKEGPFIALCDNQDFEWYANIFLIKLLEDGIDFLEDGHRRGGDDPSAAVQVLDLTHRESRYKLSELMQWKNYRLLLRMRAALEEWRQDEAKLDYESAYARERRVEAGA